LLRLKKAGFMIRCWLQLLVATVLAGCAVSAQAQSAEIVVAVAANFQVTLEQLKGVHENQSGDSITIVGGSTGKLASQISQGAPFDVFLSADDKATRLLAEAGAAVGNTEFTYAIGKLALWSADAGMISNNGEELLRKGTFQKLAYANPKVAPYGVAAVAALQALGLFDALKDKVVLAENVGGAFSMILSGNAELGFVALSQVIGSKEGKNGSYWEVPSSLYPPIRQNAVLLDRAKNNEAALSFLNFLKGGPALELIRAAGYETTPPSGG
jgi:molybdate transport system substrate-binding protein